MNNKLVCVFSFGVGAAIGSLVTWKVTKTKYEKIANEEIESVKEHFRKKTDMNDIFHDICEEKYKDNLEPESVSSVIKGEAYCMDDPEMYTVADRPFIITPEEFGELDEHEVVSITCYADNVVEDEFGEVMTVEEVDAIVGAESLKHFGEYQADSVFVRNNALKRDYEILLDLRNHSDIKRGD